MSTDKPTGRQDGRLSTTLFNLPKSLPEEENPNALFKNGWLRKGGGAFLIAPSGVGKSVWSIQAAILWSMGKPAFGIEPVRPLKIAIIQSEDDDEEMRKFMEGIAKGLVCDGKATPQEIEEACKSIGRDGGVGCTGVKFALLLSQRAAYYDLVIVNPLQAYTGIDITRPEQLTMFLRAMLDPVLKQEGKKLGVLFIHHTNKPPCEKERRMWETSIYSAYSGAGGAEMANWARAILTLFRVSQNNPLFALNGCKREDRLNWRDSAGNKTHTKYIAHSPDISYWREPSQDEVNNALGNATLTDTAGNARRLAVEITSQGVMTLTEAREKAVALFGRYHGNNAFNIVKSNPDDYGLVIRRTLRSNKQLIGILDAVERAIREMNG